MTRFVGFDSVAWFYDPLTRVVFGSRMRKSQVRFLHSISPGSTVLILGGGTGWILDELSARTKECRVWYVENSGAMLGRSVMRGKGMDVTHIQGSWENLPDITFDVVITHYFLDLFPEQTLGNVCEAIRGKLKQGAMWLASDFVCSKAWHRVLLWAMYRFFRLLCGIAAASLPDWEGCLAESGFISCEHDFFYGGFMKSVRFVRGDDR